jgi:hypothetical protein
MKDKFSFLSSTRFWKLFVVGAMAGLHLVFPDSVVLNAVELTLGVWLGGSVAVRTIDRANE